MERVPGRVECGRRACPCEKRLACGNPPHHQAVPAIDARFPAVGAREFGKKMRRAVAAAQADTVREFALNRRLSADPALF
ncbi:hypothetical protein BCO26_0650 [Heyndrickxia coagulans 2-6]|nr:hypothetical protein BCO26_0650 [Heyndrickxia coagulans 2-6]